MKYFIANLTILLTLSTFYLFPQASLEKNYSEIKKFSNYLNEQGYLYKGIEAGDDILDYLASLKNNFHEMDSIYSNLKEQIRTRSNQIKQIDKNIFSLELKLYDVGNYEIIGKRYHEQYTLVYDESNRLFAISSVIPLHVRKSYRLLRTDKKLIIRSTTSFEDYEYRVYSVYNGQFEKELNHLRRQKDDKSNQLVSYIESVAKSLQQKINVLKQVVLDSLISSYESKFKENLSLNNYKSANSILEILQKYLWERDSNTKNYEILSMQLYEDQFKFIMHLIEKEELQKAETNLMLFKDINWNKIDLKPRSEELYYKLVNKRGEKHYLESRFYESYLEYLILLKAFPKAQYLEEFFKSFSAYSDEELQSAFTQKDIKAISTVYDSLSYYERIFPDFKPLTEFNKQMKKRLPGYMNEITRVDFQATNYFFIPGGEHYLDSEYEQSKMYSFLVLKLPADEYFNQLIDIWAEEEGLTWDNLLIKTGLNTITSREREYVKAGGWMTLKEAREYNKPFFQIPEFGESRDYLTIKIGNLKNESLAQKFQQKSEEDRHKINESIPIIREQKGFKNQSRFTVGLNYLVLGYTMVTNTEIIRENKKMVEDLHFGYGPYFYPGMIGLDFCFNLSSRLSPIAQGRNRPAMTYLTTSIFVRFASNLAEYDQKSLLNVDLGIGFLFKPSVTKGERSSWYQRIITGISMVKADLSGYSPGDKFKPFISYTLGLFEFFTVLDLEGSNNNQFGISLLLTSAWFNFD